jgi:hypothetical protein
MPGRPLRATGRFVSTAPIVLIGMQRSGTTWLGGLLAARDDVAFWDEPRHVWSWGNGFRPDDRLVAADATPRIKRHIRRTFERYARERNRPRFGEKTPSNCLRVPFVREVFPEAKLLMLIRDGRSVVASGERMRRVGPGWDRLRQRLRETRPWDLPAYLSRARWLIDKARGRPVRMWGVQPPGWREWVRQDPPLVILARQWASAVRHALTDGRAVGGDYLEIRYETVVSEPRQTVQRIAEFLELPGAEGMVRAAERQARADRAEGWREGLTAEQLAVLRPHMEETLRWLGYQW